MSKYTEFFDQLPVPAQSASDILPPSQRRALKPIRILAMGLACVMLLMGITALASKALTGDWLGFLIDTAGQEDKITGMMQINETQTDGAYAVTLVNAIGDGQMMYLLFEIEDIENQRAFSTEEDLYPNMNDIYMGLKLFDGDAVEIPQVAQVERTVFRIDDRTDPNLARVIATWPYPHGRDELTSVKLGIDFMFRWDGTAPVSNYAMLAQGEWVFTVPLQYEVDIASYFFWDYVHSASYKIDISPISATVRSSHYEVDKLTGVVLKDGSVIEVINSTRSGYVTRTMKFEDITRYAVRYSYLNGIFAEAINPHDAVALLTNEGRIDLPVDRSR